jgi:hypothetical protein
VSSPANMVSLVFLLLFKKMAPLVRTTDTLRVPQPSLVAQHTHIRYRATARCRRSRRVGSKSIL